MSATSRKDLPMLALIAAMVMFTAYFLLTKRAQSEAATVNPLTWMAGISLAAALAVTPWALLASSADDYRSLTSADWGG